eukprot:50892-Pyramimonas_sp.AAC.1
MQGLWNLALQMTLEMREHVQMYRRVHLRACLRVHAHVEKRDRGTSRTLHRLHKLPAYPPLSALAAALEAIGRAGQLGWARALLGRGSL